MSTMDNKVKKKELVSQFTFNLSGYKQAYWKENYTQFYFN